MGLELFKRGSLPRWLRVRQRLDADEIGDVAKSVTMAFQQSGVGSTITAGTHVAIAVGSRGIDRIDEVVRAVVREVRRREAEPFIVPAMGSHGGATAEGQVALLAGYGITEESLDAPIRASMDTVLLGHLEDGLPVFCDRIAATEADAVIPVNRVKPHTDFHGEVESGLCKMLAIGLGKQRGANTLHSRGFPHFPRLIPAVARLVMARINIPFGIALVENGHSHLSLIEAVPARQLASREPELLRIARAQMPRLPGEAIDVLVIDRIGKDISGIGADTNVVNRYFQGPLPYSPSIQRLVIRDLSAGTEGNASGIGLADVVLQRAADKIDQEKTYLNAITAKTPEGCRIPLTVADDRTALHIALACCLHVGNSETARLVRILDTKHLEQLLVSEALYTELAATNTLEALTDPQEIAFDAQGMFVDELPE